MSGSKSAATKWRRLSVLLRTIIRVQSVIDAVLTWWWSIKASYHLWWFLALRQQLFILLLLCTSVSVTANTITCLFTQFVL